jgi:hypothetical protein
MAFPEVALHMAGQGQLVDTVVGTTAGHPGTAQFLQEKTIMKEKTIMNKIWITKINPNI